MKKFIRKWSNWWILSPKRQQLDEAFKKELEELIRREVALRPAIAVEPVLTTGLTCRKCKHNQAWQCNSKVFHYCGIRKSKQTSNGQLKIKCKNTACNMFKSIN